MAEEICCICGGPLDGENVSRCAICGQPFHMAWSVQAQVPECGRYLIRDEACSLAFICNKCLATLPKEAARGQ